MRKIQRTMNDGFHLERTCCYSRIKYTGRELLIISNLFAHCILSQPIFAKGTSPRPLSFVG